MQIHALVWLLVFGLLIGGVFLYMRGNLDVLGLEYHPHNKECKNYRIWGLGLLLAAFGLSYWLYTQEPKVIVLAES